MYKLWATIIKDLKVLSRDKVGLTLMFAMPILLVLVITSLQANTFELVNDNSVEMIICNKDGGEASLQLFEIVSQTGMFKITEVADSLSTEQITGLMHEKDALVAIIIPTDFSKRIGAKAEKVTASALKSFSSKNGEEDNKKDSLTQSLEMFYHPVLQKSYLQSIKGSLLSALQIVESKQTLNTIYFALNNEKLPEDLAENLLNSQVLIGETPISKNGERTIPNATQHNVPAWTIFAMFFVVTSLGSNVVKEKLSGSFVRLKTLPTNYLLSLLSKQIVYIGVCLMQVLVIFSLGIWLFPMIGLPKLNLPNDLFSLLLVSIVSGWCAVSYAICIGIFAQSQEQANGFGAVSVVILAALGGILVPSFAMPHSFQMLINISPLHWCLESYYELFLEGGGFKDVWSNLFPIIFITLFLQFISIFKLKKNNII